MSEQAQQASRRAEADKDNNKNKGILSSEHDSRLEKAEPWLACATANEQRQTTGTWKGRPSVRQRLQLPQHQCRQHANEEQHPVQLKLIAAVDPRGHVHAHILKSVITNAAAKERMQRAGFDESNVGSCCNVCIQHRKGRWGP